MNSGADVCSNRISIFKCRFVSCSVKSGFDTLKSVVSFALFAFIRRNLNKVDHHVLVVTN